MIKAIDKQKNIQKCQKTYIKKASIFIFFIFTENQWKYNIIIEIKDIENSSKGYTIPFVIFYYNAIPFILDNESHSK